VAAYCRHYNFGLLGARTVHGGVGDACFYPLQEVCERFMFHIVIYGFNRGAPVLRGISWAGRELKMVNVRGGERLGDYRGAKGNSVSGLLYCVEGWRTQGCTFGSCSNTSKPARSTYPEC